ncbi:MAG: hemolysin III family protein [Clostridiales bacterium]|nr:hemolysin III family protein [Clostridiales bacterium]
MAKNNKHWKNLMAREGDRKVAKEGRDPLEEGLEGLSWYENQKRIVKKRWNKTRETFGEEVGNSISAGVLAFYFLFMLPFASVRAYIHAPEGMGLIDSFGVSAFLLTGFLANLFTTIYHLMKHGTPHKRIFRKLDHIMVYFAILGVYTPACLSLIGGGLGLGIVIAELALAIGGTLLMALCFPENKPLTKTAIAIYGVMGLLILFGIGRFHAAATTPCFWLLIAGACTYVVGLFFYSGKKFKFSHMVWHLLVVAASVCHILAYVYFFR